MKIKMLSDFSERNDHPKKNDVIEVYDTIRDDNGEVELYEVIWRGVRLEIYPYECECVSDH